MRTWLVCSTVVLVAILTAAAKGQQGTERPGMATRANMFVENRGLEEAIPVVVQGVAAASPVPVRLTRQVWEYRTITLAPGNDAAQILGTYGADGWETTGIQVTDGTKIVVLLKRPS
jgi:hypothetical protein